MVKAVAQDKLDHVVQFATHEQERYLFKGFHHFFLDWPNLFTKSSMPAVVNGLKAFNNVYNAYNLLDCVENVNTLRNYFFRGKVVEHVGITISDTVNNVCESLTWANAVNIIALGSYALDWVTVVGGASLAISFAKRTVDVIKDLKNLKLNETQRKVKYCNLAFNASLLAIGILSGLSAWFGFAIIAPTMLTLSSITVISKFFEYYIPKAKQVDSQSLLTFKKA